MLGPSNGVEEIDNLPRLKNQPDLIIKLRRLIVKEKFRQLKSWTDESGPSRYEREIEAHTYRRHDFTIQLFVPWVRQVFDLTNATVIEIGSGTGSATTAFARSCRFIHGYDISEKDVHIAQTRAEIMGLHNVDLSAFPADQIIRKIIHKHESEKADIILLFAVLEHQTLAERMALLESIPRIVRPGGIVVVCETPNRIAPFDYHSSQLPFFNSLPIELKKLVGAKSPRPDFAALFDSANQDKVGFDESITRFGEGVSYHEFELIFGQIHDNIIADGFHPNIRRARGERPEDVFTRLALEEVAPWVHPVFSLHYLDFVFKI